MAHLTATLLLCNHKPYDQNEINVCINGNFVENKNKITSKGVNPNIL
jgi:hypothetical protein